MPENRSGSVPPSVGGPRVTSKVASLSSQRVSLPHDDDPLHHLDHCGEQFPTRVGKFLEPENPLSSSLSNFTDGATVHTPDTTEETARDSSRPPSSENCMRRRTARRHFSAPSEGTSLVAATAPTRACTPRIQQLTDWKASAAASQDTESTCVIIRDERYSWEHITGRRMHRPTEMSAHCSRRLYPIGRSPGEHRAGDTHGNPAVGIVHSVFSSFPASFRALFRRLYGGQQQSLVSPSRASQQQVSRQHHRSPHSLNSLSLIATGPNFLRGPANDFEHFVEEHEDSMMFRGYELDHPIFFILSEGDEAEEVMPLASRNPNERLLSLRQVLNAHNIGNRLNVYAFKWTYDEGMRGNGHPVTRCFSSAGSEEAGSVKGALQRTSTKDDGGFGIPSCQPQDQDAHGCCICLSSFKRGESMFTLRCFHIFHAECLERWIQTSSTTKCPLCFTEIAE
ncbi:uncharacterized protein LOC34623070 [Cyclospora cayetanensis]|uniref:RING-type E3 ubiquitin transferase n=1 Tax=Cyclospora cayetanensis TaxID=88456 RepID=A0A6P6RTU6_9EIME|nr:uncharacterized protein LOC34623070 [Cyclospora cayetanensis]